MDEAGREFYAVSTEFDGSRAIPWVRRHVLDKLPSPADPAWRSRARIRDELHAFLTAPGEPIELWAWYAAYDHVALAQLWGAMPALPREIPRFTHELAQRWEDAGRPPLPRRRGPARRARRRPAQPGPLARHRAARRGPRWPAGPGWQLAFSVGARAGRSTSVSSAASGSPILPPAAACALTLAA